MKSEGSDNGKVRAGEGVVPVQEGDDQGAVKGQLPRDQLVGPSTGRDSEAMKEGKLFKLLPENLSARWVCCHCCLRLSNNPSSYKLAQSLPLPIHLDTQT